MLCAHGRLAHASCRCPVPAPRPPRRVRACSCGELGLTRWVSAHRCCHTLLVAEHPFYKGRRLAAALGGGGGPAAVLTLDAGALRAKDLRIYVEDMTAAEQSALQPFCKPAGGRSWGESEQAVEAILAEEAERARKEGGVALAGQGGAGEETVQQLLRDIGSTTVGYVG